MRALYLGAAVLLGACGDVAKLELTLDFADAELEASTAQLLLVIREPPAEGDACVALWGPIPDGLGEYARLVPYPNRNDLLAAPLKDGRYTLFAYSYDQPIDALCQSDADCKAASAPSCRAIGGGQRGCGESSAPLLPRAGGCAGGFVGEDAPPVVLSIVARGLSSS